MIGDLCTLKCNTVKQICVVLVLIQNITLMSMRLCSLSIRSIHFSFGKQHLVGCDINLNNIFLTHGPTVHTLVPERTLE